jgi:hypothetical protein
MRIKPTFPFFLFLFLFILSIESVKSQTADTTVVASDALSVQKDSAESEQKESLLPTNFIPTQRLLWGEKGLMRNFDAFTLTEEHRDKELEIRGKMIIAHRYLGFATLAGMIAQGIVGQRLYDGHQNLKGLHETIAGAVNIGYFGTASLALFAPPRMSDVHAGFSTLKVHKYLSVVHLSGMIATNVLSGMADRNHNLKALHRATAYTAFGAFFASMVVIQF